MILITGGAGFIGSHIVDILIENNYEVVVVDNLSSGKKENINSKALFYEIDIKNFDTTKEVFKKHEIEYVLHLAAQVSVPYSTKNPIDDANENIIATLNIIELSKEYNVKKILVSSTAAVYGGTKYLPIDENHETNPMSFYGLSKLTMEKYLALSNVNYIIFRFANVYGPRQTPHGEAGVVSIFVDNTLNNKDVLIFGDGNQTRDFIYVLDIARVFYACISKEINNEIINVSTGRGITINDLYNRISSFCSNDTKAIYKEERENDIRDSVLDNKKMLKVLESSFSELDEGLNDTVSYFKRNKK